MRKTFAVILVLLTLGTGLAFAQNRTSLNIQCNEVGAEVYINGRLAGKTTPNFSFLVPQGNVQVRVQKNGFQTFETVVRAGTSPITLNVTLQRIGAVVTPPPPPPQNYNLLVNANVAGAEVIINNVSAGRVPFTASLAPGSYTLVVRAPGYTDYVENLVISGNRTVNAVLQGAFAAVTIVSNVQGADVIINEGQPFSQRGKAPFTANLPMGGAPYNIRVTAPGYLDFNQTVSVTGPVTVTANLQPAMVPLVLNNLRPGAEIFLNGARIGVANSATFTAQVAPGTYTLTIRLGGFLDFTTQVTVGAAAPQTIAPVFQPQPASYSFNIPANIQNPDMKGNPWSQIRLFIDGVAQKDFRGQVTPGRHTIRIVSGAFAFETSFDFEAGKAYSFEPFLGLNIR